MDEIERFLLFVEQFEEAVRLLEKGRLALQRMALVAFDTLAEGLLFRHMEALFLASDEPTWMERRRYTATERREARDRFNKRVALAVEKIEGLLSFSYPKPILDETDAVIFRVAHRHRNPVYHQDRHNPTLIKPLSRLYAHAVGRAFTRSQMEGFGVGGFSDFPWVELERFAWQRPDSRMFYPREAAEAITTRICEPFQVDDRSLRRELADDVAYRCDVIEEDLAGLRADGIGEARLAEFLEAVQHWAANRGDEVVLRLEAERQALQDRILSAESVDTETREAMRRLDQQQWARLFGPDRQSTVKVDLGTPDRIRSKGERLRGWSGGVGRLLEKYQQLDEELEFFEAALDFMIREWDRQVSLEEDIARGK